MYIFENAEYTSQVFFCFTFFRIDGQSSDAAHVLHLTSTSMLDNPPPLELSFSPIEHPLTGTANALEKADQIKAENLERR